MNHDWCEISNYCLRCGAAFRDYFDHTRRQCNDGVVPISHLLWQRRFAPMISYVKAQMEFER